MITESDILPTKQTKAAALIQNSNTTISSSQISPLVLNGMRDQIEHLVYIESKKKKKESKHNLKTVATNSRIKWELTSPPSRRARTIGDPKSHNRNIALSSTNKRCRSNSLSADLKPIRLFSCPVDTDDLAKALETELHTILDSQSKRWGIDFSKDPEEGCYSVPLNTDAS